MCRCAACMHRYYGRLLSTLGAERREWVAEIALLREQIAERAKRIEDIEARLEEINAARLRAVKSMPAAVAAADSDHLS